MCTFDGRWWALNICRLDAAFDRLYGQAVGTLQDDRCRRHDDLSNPVVGHILCKDIVDIAIAEWFCSFAQCMVHDSWNRWLCIDSPEVKKGKPDIMLEGGSHNLPNLGQHHI